MQSTGMQRLTVNGWPTAAAPRAHSHYCHPFPTCFAFFFFRKQQGWVPQLWKSTSDKDDLKIKLGGRGRSPAAQLAMSARGEKKEKGRGKGKIPGGS